MTGGVATPRDLSTFSFLETIVGFYTGPFARLLFRVFAQREKEEE